MTNQQQRSPKNAYDITAKPFLQVKQYSSNANPLSEDFTMQGIALFNGNQGQTYYGDLEEQTRASLHTFVKEPKERHCCMLLFIIFLLVMVIIYFELSPSFFMLAPWIATMFIGIPYIFYLIVGLRSNPLGQYFSNMKNASNIETTFGQLKRRTGHIHFKAECYHFTGGKSKSRVVTHTASQIIPVRECIDASENISQIKEDNSSYIFCKIKRFFFFADPNSHNAFINAFTHFKNSNVQDTFQKYTHSLDLTMPDFTDQIGFSRNGTGDCLKPMYIIFLLLGLGYPYLIAIECMGQRYSFNITKRLSL